MTVNYNIPITVNYNVQSFNIDEMRHISFGSGTTCENVSQSILWECFTKYFVKMFHKVCCENISQSILWECFIKCFEKMFYKVFCAVTASRVLRTGAQPPPYTCHITSLSFSLFPTNTHTLAHLKCQGQSFYIVNLHKSFHIAHSAQQTLFLFLSLFLSLSLSHSSNISASHST